MIFGTVESSGLIIALVISFFGQIVESSRRAALLAQAIR